MMNLAKTIFSAGMSVTTKCSLLAAVGLILLTIPSEKAGAQVFYQFPGAPVVTDEHPAIGPAIAIGDNLFRINGYGRFNVTSHMDMGLEVVFDDIHDNWFAGAGGDVKYAIAPVDYEMPFDISLNAGIGFNTGNDITTIQVPFGAVISRPLKLSSGNVLTPYGGLYILIDHVSYDAGPHGNYSDTDTDVELRLGSSLRLASSTDIFAALHLGSGTKFYVGMNFRL